VVEDVVKSALPKPTRYCASRSPKSFWQGTLYLNSVY